MGKVSFCHSRIAASSDLNNFAFAFAPKNNGEISIILKGLRAGGL